MSLVPDYIKNLLPYKAGKPIDEVKRELNLNKVIKLASNENPLGPSLQSISAIKESLKNISLEFSLKLSKGRTAINLLSILLVIFLSFIKK